MGLSFNVTNLPMNSAPASLSMSNPNTGESQAPTKQLEIFGHKFFGNDTTAPHDFKNSEGITAAAHTHEGVLAHERAHDNVARAAGLSTSGPVLQKQSNITVSGFVNIGVPQFDKNRALVDDAYLKMYQRQAKGLVDSATAPERAGIGKYGRMSDADHNVAAMGRQKMAEAQAFESQRAQILQEQQQRQQANYAYNPGLMDAFNSGMIQ